MRPILAAGLFLLLSIPCRAQQGADTSSFHGADRIITFQKEVFVGKIQQVTLSDVYFTLPGDTAMQKISRTRISQILYANGRRDLFIALDDARVKQKELVDTSRIIVKGQKDWMKVQVTEDPAAVNNLLALGEIKTRYEAETGNVNNEELMRRASVALKKKAASMKAHCVLIETKFFHKPYGELPVVEVTATAYGYRM